ncbi:uncharacterized protein [Haliotis cracherodii]|uniref:uncharacterized protein isoform X1 n=1 Tax=Haliotis cracherodii TaxID=6455 RepID=UPI0039ED6F48
MERQDDSRLGSGFSTSDKRHLKCCVDDIALKHTCTCRNYVNIGVVVCVVLTLTTLAACWYTVVCSRQVKEQVLQLQKLQTFVHNSDIEFDDDTGETLHFLPGQSSGEEGRAVGVVPGARRVRREADSDTKKPKMKRRKNQNGKKGKRGSRKGGGKFCNRIAKCQAPSSSSSMTAPTPAKPHSLRASHFTVDGSTLSGQTIGSLHPARWVNAHVTPAAMSRDNSVSVVESGVYLVYTSVLFNDTKYREGLLVTRNDVELFKCFDGVDYIDHSKERTQNFKFKTCSVSGITYLSKGDDLRMVNLYPNTNIDINEGSTFIGLVQLIPAIDPN